MNCNNFLPALETGGFVRRIQARRHAARCPRCAAVHAALAAAKRQLAAAEPLSPRAERLWRQAVGEATVRPARGNAWKMVTAGAVSVVCLVMVFLLAISKYINNSPTPASQPTVARNESRSLSPITVEEIDTTEGLAYQADEVRRLDVELKSLQQVIEKKSVQRQIAAVLERFGEPPSPTPE